VFNGDEYACLIVARDRLSGDGDLEIRAAGPLRALRA